VGRRLVDDEKAQKRRDEQDTDAENDDPDIDDDNPKPKRKSSKSTPSNNKKKSPLAGSGGKNGASESDEYGEYEYLVKYKGRSYLHLEWKTGADLESMNKSAKGIHRRYLRKLEAGLDEDAENPEFDPSFAVPEKVLDVEEQELNLEMTDAEIMKWEKQRELELAMEEDEEDSDDDKEKGSATASNDMAVAQSMSSGNDGAQAPPVATSSETAADPSTGAPAVDPATEAAKRADENGATDAIGK
jgi:hypothetical protein